MADVFPGFIGHNELIKIGKISLVIMSTLLVPFKENWRRRKKIERRKRQAEAMREYSY